jgi:hypothetical protein
VDLYREPGRSLDEDELDARTVRPYTVTRGRTRAGRHELALETLVRSRPGARRPPLAPSPLGASPLAASSSSGASSSGASSSGASPSLGASRQAPAVRRIWADSSEHRRILELVADRLLSVAGLSAHLHVPLGVTRVLVGVLVDEGLVAVHGGTEDSLASAADLEVLESVLDGISSL